MVFRVGVRWVMVMYSTQGIEWYFYRNVYNPMQLKRQTVEAIEYLIERYPQKRSAVLPVLHQIQADLGHISKEAITWVADKLCLQPINVYEVVTFYPFFREKPLGRRHIRVCRTLPCALRGAHRTCAVLQEELGCRLNQVAEDGSVSIEFVECLANCHHAPVVMVNDELHEDVDETQARILGQAVKNDGKAGNCLVS